MSRFYLSYLVYFVCHLTRIVLAGVSLPLLTVFDLLSLFSAYQQDKI